MALVGIVLAAVQAFASDSDQKRDWQYMIALSMAYGHIVGAAIFSLSRHRLASIPGIDKLLIASVRDHSPPTSSTGRASSGTFV